MQGEIRQRLQAELDGIREAGLWKGERIVEGPQGAHVPVDGREVLNFCANNYLGLADDPTLVRAAPSVWQRRAVPALLASTSRAWASVARTLADLAWAPRTSPPWTETSVGRLGAARRMASPAGTA